MHTFFLNSSFLFLIIWQTKFVYRGIIIVQRGSIFVDFVGYHYLRIYIPTKIEQSNVSSCIVKQQTNYPRNYEPAIYINLEYWPQVILRMISQYSFVHDKIMKRACIQPLDSTKVLIIYSYPSIFLFVVRPFYITTSSSKINVLSNLTVHFIPI